MKESKSKPNISIRIDPEALHQAKVEAIKAKKTLGQWLEEAIKEKAGEEKGRTAGEGSEVAAENKGVISQKESKKIDKAAPPSVISLLKQRR
ncbi:MAG: hypothetical protein PHI12_01350 [Dehalococcoidales bacterium]|mgnify:CR=1 FL=1|nr:hypothetical protein [Dehalococcoidales bacterium]